MDSGQLWALVIAGHEPDRARDAVITPGRLHHALNRAKAIAVRRRIGVVVAREDRRQLADPLWFLPASNVVMHPEGGGTAPGVLLALLRAVSRDARARVVVLPATHRVDDEATFASTLRDVVTETITRPQNVFVLGVMPDAAHTGYPYIVPGSREGNAFTVARFVDSPARQFPGRPAADLARELLVRRALWSTGIVVGSALALLQLFERRFPGVSSEMWEAAVHAPRERAELTALDGRFVDLMKLDFHRHVLLRQREHLHVLPIARSGWSDVSATQLGAVAAGRTFKEAAAQRLLAAPSAPFPIPPPAALGVVPRGDP